VKNLATLIVNCYYNKVYGGKRMAIGDYLKIAAAQLRRAAVECKQLSIEVRREMDQRSRDVVKEMDAIEDAIRVKQAQVNNSRMTPIMRAERLREVNELKKQLQDIKRDFELEKKRMQGEVVLKEQDMNDLENQARTFETRATEM
jgi:hypothetical protein